MTVCSSRRGLLRGVSGLAAVSVAGCPKRSVEPAVSVAETLTGMGVSEASVRSAVRAIQARPEAAASVLLQHRRTLLVRRDRHGPTLERDITHGAVARSTVDGQSVQAGTNRTDDETLQVLLERVGVASVAEPAEGTEAPQLLLLPTRVPGLSTPSPTPDVVGASIALIFAAMARYVPEALDVVWEQVDDDRLQILADGRLVRARETWGRLSLRAIIPTASGRMRLFREAGPEIFAAADGSAVEQWVDAIGQSVLEQASAVSAAAGSRAVILEPDVLLDLVLAGGRQGWETPLLEAPASGAPGVDDTGRELDAAPWSGQTMRRVAWNRPDVGWPRTLRWPEGDGARAEPEDVLRVAKGRIQAIDAVSAWIDIDDAWLEAREGRRRVRSGSRVRIPKSAFDAMVSVQRAPGAFRRVVVGPPGDSLVVGVMMPAVLVQDCSVEGPDGG